MHQRPVSSSRGLWFAALLLAASLVGSACGSTDDGVSDQQGDENRSTSVPSVQSTPSLEYLDGDEGNPPFLLDVHATSMDGTWPVVVVVHGYGGNRFDLQPLARALADKGAVVFAPNVEMFEPFDEAITQIACAVRFARRHAAEFGGDPASIGLVGYSSGAHTGSIVAMREDDFDGRCVVTEGSATPEVFVGFEGPYDVASRVYGDIDLTPLEAIDHDLWAAVNPYTHVGGNRNVKIKLIHGVDEDILWYDIPPDVSTSLYDALVEGGHDVDISLLDGVDHTDLYRVDSTEAVAAVVADVLALMSDSS